MCSYFSTDYTTTYSSKVKLPKVDKSKLSVFFKSVHPDLLGSAPAEYRTHNSNSMQDLNNYINSLEQNVGAPYTKIEFYIKSTTSDKEYAKHKIELLAIKPNVSSELMKMHIKGVIDTLNKVVMKAQGKEDSTKMKAKIEFTGKPIKPHKIFVTW